MIRPAHLALTTMSHSKSLKLLFVPILMFGFPIPNSVLNRSTLPSVTSTHLQILYGAYDGSKADQGQNHFAVWEF